MKSVLLAILVSSAIIAAFATDFPKNSIEVDPLNIGLGGVYEIRYERGINENIGIFAEYGYRYKQTMNLAFYDYSTDTWNGYDVLAGARFYPYGKYSGLYIAGSFEYRHVKLSGGFYNGQYYNEMSPGFKAGYKWLFFGHIPLSIGVGVNVPIQDWHVNESSGSNVTKYDGFFRLAGELMMGVSF